MHHKLKNFSDILRFITLPLILAISPQMAYWSSSHAAEVRGKPYTGEYHFVKIKRKRDAIKDIPRAVLLPVVSDKNREEFEKRAFIQVSKFFANYNFVIPSFIEIDNFIKENEIKESDYETKFAEIAKAFQAKYVIFLRINRISQLKKINAAGTLVAGATVTGVGRYAAGEFVMKVFNPDLEETQSYSAIERRKDHILGFFQSAKRLALKLQDETLQSLLSDFARQKIERSEGYILTPIQSYFPDAKGFQ